MNDADRAFVAEHAPKIPLAGGLGLEINRPAGFEQSISGVQVLEKLGYPGTGFSEQTQSWNFRATWPLMEQSSEVPEYEAFYDTFSLIAAMASQTETIRLTSTTDCYRRSPSVMAQMLLTLDHISKGRVSVLVGTGENKQFVPHGLERVLPRNKRLEEFVRTVKVLLRTTEPVTLDGEFWPQKDALIALPPYNPDIPPMIGIVGGGPGAMKIAGRVADMLGSYFPGAYANDVGALEEDLSIMRGEAARHDRDPASIPVGGPYCSVLCESDEEITRALESPFIRGFIMNLTPTAAHWERWGSQHPLGDYCLSNQHRSTNFTQKELLDAFAKVTDHDIQQMVYVGTPEDVAKRFEPWCRAAGVTKAPLGLANDFGVAVFKEHRELTEDGLPRWHHLQLRFCAEMNRLLGAG